MSLSIKCDPPAVITSGCNDCVTHMDLHQLFSSCGLLPHQISSE